MTSSFAFLRSGSVLTSPVSVTSQPSTLKLTSRSFRLGSSENALASCTRILRSKSVSTRTGVAGPCTAEASTVGTASACWGPDAGAHPLSANAQKAEAKEAIGRRFPERTLSEVQTAGLTCGERCRENRREISPTGGGLRLHDVAHDLKY